MTAYKVVCESQDGTLRDVSTVSVGSQRIYVETYKTYEDARVVMREMQKEFAHIGCQYFVEAL